MNTSAKIFVTQAVSVILSYVLSNYVGDYSNSGNFWVMTGGFISLFYWPFIYVAFVVFISTLWFQGLNKWSYLIPAFLVLLFVVFLGYLSNDLLFVLKYWLIAFVGGWVLARVVNFVAGFAKK